MKEVGGGGGAFSKDEACRSDEGGLTRPQTTAIDQFLSTSSTGQATSWLPLPSGPLFRLVPLTTHLL